MVGAVVVTGTTAEPTIKPAVSHVVRHSAALGLTKGGQLEQVPGPPPPPLGHTVAPTRPENVSKRQDKGKREWRFYS